MKVGVRQLFSLAERRRVLGTENKGGAYATDLLCSFFFFSPMPANGAAMPYVFRIKYRERWSPDINAARGLEMYVHARNSAAPADARLKINKNGGNGAMVRFVTYMYACSLAARVPRLHSPLVRFLSLFLFVCSVRLCV